MRNWPSRERLWPTPAMVRELDPWAVNSTTGLSELMSNWSVNLGTTAPRRNSAVRRSPAGNINLAGSPFSSTAAIANPKSAGFWDYIEPGVRELVRVLVEHHGLVTFSSCEGHLYKHGADSRGGECRSVSVAIRGESEHRKVAGVFKRVAASCDQSHAVEAALRFDQVLDKGKAIPEIDFVFWKTATANWDTYFQELPVMYSSVVELFAAESPISPNHIASAGEHEGSPAAGT